MRLWSIHPRYLDRQGLLAVWREGLLAQKVLMGQTKGYKNHPQLERFKKLYKTHPKSGKNEFIGHYYLSTYLHYIADEAEKRGYKFDRTKLFSLRLTKTWKAIKLTTGQLEYELSHLLRKLWVRDMTQFNKVCEMVGGHIDFEHYEPEKIDPHPLFKVIKGNIETWEKVK